MWKFADGKKQFSGGTEDYVFAAQAADDCGCFVADEEEEWMADDELSCYNCRYRRWTATGFICMKKI